MATRKTKTPRGEAWILAKAAKDKKFRKELMAAPKAVMERELGVKLPASLAVQVLVDSAKVRHLVLPKKPEIPELMPIGGKLTDKQMLAMLKGGEKPIGYSFCPNENDNI